jgi:hypothetical protein
MALASQITVASTKHMFETEDFVADSRPATQSGADSRDRTLKDIARA